jgi:asparagine synthetase B (glutamine-hydrolysing)
VVLVLYFGRRIGIAEGEELGFEGGVFGELEIAFALVLAAKLVRQGGGALQGDCSEELFYGSPAGFSSISLSASAPTMRWPFSL